VANIERMANQATVNMRTTLARLRSLASGFLVLSTVIAVATFLTGLWVFSKNRGTWIVIGGLLCAIPLIAALIGMYFVASTAKLVPGFVGEVRQLISESRQSAGVLIDHDSGRSLATTAKSFTELKTLLKERRKELPALFAGVRALSSVPGLLAIALLGVLFAGVLGTVLLIVGLLR